MKTQSARRGDSLYIYLTGELDEYTVSRAREEADDLIDDSAWCSRAVFNLAGVRFMDSTGIGFLIGRYKRLRRAGTPLYVQSPTPAADRILSMGGLYPIIPKI